MTEKLKISLPIIVEGRYDKATLSGYVSANIITTDGFAVFNNKEKQRLIRRLCDRGVILLTDSDGGGKQIRSFLSGILPKDKIYHLYIPEIEGKEKRKTHASAAGLLGVEGMKKDVILRLLEPFSGDEIPQKSDKMITKVDFFQDGLTGCPGSSEKRERVCSIVDLPRDMTPNALLSALNMLIGYEEYKKLINQIFGG